MLGSYLICSSSYPMFLVHTLSRCLQSSHAWEPKAKCILSRCLEVCCTHIQLHWKHLGLSLVCTFNSFSHVRFLAMNTCMQYSFELWPNDAFVQARYCTCIFEYVYYFPSYCTNS